MRAHVVERPGPPEVLELKEHPDPEAREGWVVIRVRAFGLNRSEMYTRLGQSGGAVTFPRVLGIEAVGEVIDNGGTDLEVGQLVATAMGGMGRSHDGGYAELAINPRSNVFALDTQLPWDVVGAVPETFLTAWGTVVETMKTQPGWTVLVRGASSSVGMASVVVAKDIGCKVIATTRQAQKRDRIGAAGADHVLVDDDTLVEQVRSVSPDGVDGVVEVVGSEQTIREALSLTRPRGSVGLVGHVADEWDYTFFPPIPSMVSLSRYGSLSLEASWTTPVLQKIFDKVASGEYDPCIDSTYGFDEVVQAHRVMDNNEACGKLVVVL